MEVFQSDDLVFCMMAGSTGFIVYRTQGKSPGSCTQLFVEVPDLGPPVPVGATARA